MTFPSLLNRRVTVVPMVITGKDSAGNDVKAPGTAIGPVHARRDSESETEIIASRDEQEVVFFYWLALLAEDGTPVVITGRDRLVDGDETFEVRGTPELVAGQARVHHIEVHAYRITG